MLYCRPALPIQIGEVKSVEERGEWEAASKLVQSAMADVDPQNHSSIAGLEETIAYFKIRSALQAEKREDFGQRILEAAALLRNASSNYSKSKDRIPDVVSAACLARAISLEAWMSSRRSERTEHLARAFNPLKSSMMEILRVEEIELRYSILGDLLLFALEWASSVHYDPESAAVLGDLLSLCDNELDSRTENFSDRKARLLCLAGQLARQASFWARNDQDQVELSSKAVQYAKWSKQVTESNSGSDPFLNAIVDISLGQTLADFESDPVQEEALWRRALQAGVELKDHYTVSWSASLLSYNLGWRLAETEEAGEMSRLSKDCFRFGDMAIAEGSIIRFSHIIAFTLAGPISTTDYNLALSEPDRTKRKQLRQRAVENAKLSLKAARTSGCLLDLASAYHSLSKAVEGASVEESDRERQRVLLYEALKLREVALATRLKIFPPRIWSHGVQLHYMATLLHKLATLEKGKSRDSLVSRAVKASATCVEYCSSTATGTEAREKYGVHLARYVEYHARLLEELAAETENRILLEKALTTYRRASELYDRQRLFNHSALNYWRSANLSHLLGLHDESCREFLRGSECYESVEKDIPHLRSNFHGLALYMKAWYHAEGAHYAHLMGDYAKASGHYREASTLLHESPEREYLSTNFLAWASLESAEDLSRIERVRESSTAFLEASALFEKCRELELERHARIENIEERSQADKVRLFSESQSSYCHARALLDQGRLEEIGGDYLTASRLHDRAASLLKSSLERIPEEGRQDIVYALDLARGWSLLCLARTDAEPKKFLKAAAFFDLAARASPNEQASKYAMGNKYLSQALAFETRFLETADPKQYRTAKRLLRNASVSYSSAGMDNSSLEVDARLSLLDASLYTNRAENSSNPKLRTQHLSLAEKCLRHSLQLYRKAGDRSNSEQVENLLGKISQRKRLGRLLRETLERPLVASPASLLYSPSHGPESASGLAHLDERLVGGNLSVPDELWDDREFTVTLDLVNLGNAPVSLLQVTGLLPQAAKMVGIVSKHTIHDGTVEFEGKKLQPNALESISVRCLSNAGLLELAPRIIYLNAEGKPTGHQVAPTARHVMNHATFEFASPHAQVLFDFLASEFVADYMTRHLSEDASGWRSFPSIVKGTRVARSALYSPRGLGGPIAELERRGLVEVRVFPNQPGRGGRVQKVRVYYEKNPVRRFVDNLAMKTGASQQHPL